MSAWLQNTLRFAAAAQGRIATSCIVVLALLILRRIVLGIAWGRTHDPRSRYRWQKTTTSTVSFMGLVLFIRIWFGAVPDVASFSGLFAAGIAIALRDIIVN